MGASARDSEAPPPVLARGCLKQEASFWQTSGSRTCWLSQHRSLRCAAHFHLSKHAHILLFRIGCVGLQLSNGSAAVRASTSPSSWARRCYHLRRWRHPPPPWLLHPLSRILLLLLPAHPPPLPLGAQFAARRNIRAGARGGAQAERQEGAAAGQAEHHSLLSSPLAAERKAER